ncbi:chorismate synthase [Campylobacter hyointestinalis subsp. hyointestinalis]|uniref:Chorismate synthase n=2 Tax=Campylobacter TaxID=194 RepID=A0A0S4SKV1_CAMHY|nr:chorismate synthase [Campylobacter hyointestinalis]PPB52009.1 chorismate synthase [Campylobacter hyointestinalis subsp. hyointestinalis]PPB53420.1 chorismate synthase [Campylobacter hyointestinalis subsp. hyointestinalis]PPB61472.1 chorismate synthase [Campylobacter hyointestinalis subsp. hyointestinalis]PPB65507.1 chorismate synthase [Campylobacter hyointestinalis subsp. hyointestinalis]PPB66356.1 chorismate synthase [Campylobacter hyointestinalis subsp. hyointestinalis]
MNTFGKRLRLSTFGESHGVAIGGILDGLPAGVRIDEEYLQSELDKRKPGGKYATNRKEDDKVEILSGVFDGFSTGHPIGFMIKNSNQHSKDYDNIKELFRPGHADFTYYHKFGIRDHRGGGRSSARETAVRVAAGAIAEMMLGEFGISVKSGVFGVGLDDAKKVDFEFAKTSEIFCLDKNKDEAWKEIILNAKNSGDSVGATILSVISGVPVGLGEVLYDKLDAALAGAFMGINGVKAVEIGDGIEASKANGSSNNDLMDKNGFKSNHAGGILGGISNGQDIIIRSYFKPTPSIFMDQPTLNVNGDEVICALRGRHDPCIGIRGSVVATAMARLVIADMLLLNASSKLENLKKIYC